MTTLWQNRSPGDRHLSTYFCFAAVRLLLVFVPQLGYVHPDEFFQSVEVMTGEDWLLQCPSANVTSPPLHRRSLSAGAYAHLGVQQLPAGEVNRSALRSAPDSLELLRVRCRVPEGLVATGAAGHLRVRGVPPADLHSDLL